MNFSFQPFSGERFSVFQLIQLFLYQRLSNSKNSAQTTELSAFTLHFLQDMCSLFIISHSVHFSPAVSFKINPLKKNIQLTLDSSSYGHVSLFFSFNTHFFKYSTYSTKHYHVFEWGDSSNHYSTYSSLNPNYLHIRSPTDTVQSLKRSQDTELTLSLYLSCQSLIVFLQFQFKFNAPPPPFQSL